MFINSVILIRYNCFYLIGFHQNFLSEIFQPFSKMKFFNAVFSVLKNKYFVALLVFLGVMFFFDENDVFVQLDRKQQLTVLEAKKKFYEEAVAKTQKQLTDLQSNSQAIEKYARENFYMKKSNEDLFIVVNP